MINERTNPLDGTRVLIVEDEYFLADDLSRTLTEAGAQVVGPIATVAEALRLSDDRAFDCAILDMNLRGDFAFAVAERLSESRVPFVIATGYNQSSLPQQLLEVPRIEKPFAPADVVDLLAEIRQKTA